MLEEDTNTDIVTVEAEEISEESPLLVAQRYLNIFHQIHIFKAKKKAEFDIELLNMPEKIKRLLVNIPGGRILLEHILDLEEKNNLDTQLTKSLIAQRRKENHVDEHLYGSPARIGGEIHVGADFANTLAKSLAVALGRNPYQQQVPQIIGENGEVSALTPDSPGNQTNTQNNAAATTVNNINVDYSIFQNLAEAINKTNSSLAQVLKENSKQQLEEMKTFSRTLTDVLLGKDAAKKVESSLSQKTAPSSTSKTFQQPAQNNAQRSSYNLRSSKPADPILRAQNVISRTGLNVKPVSLSVEESPSSFVSQPKAPAQASKTTYEEYTLDENLNMYPTATPGNDDEWEYVDEYGNPVTDVSDGEWEYVDEYGNPVTDVSDGEWEYVDEHGNPVNTSPLQSKISDNHQEQSPTSASKVETNKQDSKSKEKPENVNFVPPLREEIKVEEKKAEQISLAPQPEKEAPKEEQVSLAPQDSKETKSGGIFSLFKKKNISEETAKTKQPETPKKDMADDVLAAAFANQTVAKSPEPQPETQKKDTADDVLAAAFANQTEAKSPEPQPEAPKKDTADDVLAAAFANQTVAKSPEPQPEAPKKDTADDVLAAAFANQTEAKSPEPQPETSKKDTADDVLAAAFANQTEVNSPAEQKEQTPRIGGILAEAFQEVEREQKTISSKDLLAQTIKSKPQSTADVLASAFVAKPEEAKKDIDSALTEAFSKPADKAKQDTELDALIKAFNS